MKIFDFSSSFLIHIDPDGTSNESGPVPEGWTGTGELRQLPSLAIRLIAERAAEQDGRGHRARFAVKGTNWHYVVTVKSDGRLIISPR